MTITISASDNHVECGTPLKTSRPLIAMDGDDGACEYPLRPVTLALTLKTSEFVLIVAAPPVLIQLWVYFKSGGRQQGATALSPPSLTRRSRSPPLHERLFFVIHRCSGLMQALITPCPLATWAFCDVPCGQVVAFGVVPGFRASLSS